MKTYEFLTAPVAFLGYLWHLLAEAPFHRGRYEANKVIYRLADKDS